MKNHRSAVVFLIITSIALCAGAQAKQKKTPPAPAAKGAAKTGDGQPDNDHGMQNAAPAEAHSRLAKLAGVYTTTTRFYMQPGPAPQETPGEAKLWMGLDGRFLMEDSTGTFMGQPLKGFRMVGYNNASKRYEGIWTYTMSTGIMALNGSSADGGKTVSFDATFDGEGGAKEKLSVVMRLKDDDHFAWELIATLPDGKPGPRLETIYTRKK